VQISSDYAKRTGIPATEAKNAEVIRNTPSGMVVSANKNAPSYTIRKNEVDGAIDGVAPKKSYDGALNKLYGF
jgi:hypothetical protein